MIGNIPKTAVVGDMMRFVVETPSCVRSDECMGQALQRMVDAPCSRHVYVLGEGEKVVGSIRLNCLIEFFFPYSAFLGSQVLDRLFNLVMKKSVQEFMLRNFSYVHEETKATETLTIMLREKVNELPVVDNQMRLMGEVNMLEVVKFYFDRNGHHCQVG